MARPKNVNHTLKEKLQKIKQSGIIQDSKQKPVQQPEEDLFEASLKSRIRRILQIVDAPGKKPFEMLFLVMYDIEDNRVRHQIAKYLLGKGCIRIQKSVYLARTHQRVYSEITETLADIQAMYENADSILIAPVQASMLSSMRIIGKNIEIQSLIDPPNTLFY